VAISERHACSSANDEPAVNDNFTHLAINNTLQVQLHTLISRAVHKRLRVAEIAGRLSTQLKKDIDWFGDGQISIRRRLENNCILVMNFDIADVRICFPHEFAIWWLLVEPNLYVICRHTHTHTTFIRVNLCKLRTGGFCWSKVLLLACLCRWQLVHSD